MPGLAQTKKLIFDGWSDEAVAAFLHCPVAYVTLTREGKANPLHPWPNGKTGSLDEAKK